MKIGDRVKWTSQSASYRTTKRGEIVALVPAKTPPGRCIPYGYRCGSPAGFGMSRDHESYLVKVDGKGRGLYWPRVKHLSVSDDSGGTPYRGCTGSALALAKQFHDIYERLAPAFGYETRPETRDFDHDSANGRLMVAVCQEIIEQNSTLCSKKKEIKT